jgi:hypothetical protein
MKHAYDNNFPTLKAAYKDLMWDAQQANTQAETLKKQAERNQTLKKNGVVIKGGQGGSVSKPGYKPGMDYSDLAKAALQSLGG